MKKRKVLWIGDAVVATGFSRCTHGVLEALKSEWDIRVIGLNYFGDPHPYDYPMYPAIRPFKRDMGFGVERIPDMVAEWGPDVIVVLNDPWNIPMYLQAAGNVPMVAWLAVDGKNCRGRGLNGLHCAVFWTEFARREAMRGGYSGDSAVVPLGVNLDMYAKMRDKEQARKLCGIPDRVMDAFIVGNVNRNQPRKRLDLTVAYFAEWVKTRGVNDAYLWLHVAPTGEQGYDVKQLAEYFGIANRLILAEPDIGHGVPEQSLMYTYNAFDALFTTTQGEGWSLPTMEAMACGVPCIVPDWAALGEWPEDAVMKVECSEIAVTPNKINAIGGIADREQCIEALDRMYNEPDLREEYGERGRQLVAREYFRWPNIGAAFGSVLDQALSVDFLRTSKNPEVREAVVG